MHHYQAKPSEDEKFIQQFIFSPFAAYVAYTGTGRWTGCGFWPLCPKQGI